MIVAYLNLAAGAAGDMLIAALLDSGLDCSVLKREISKLELSSEVSISSCKVLRASLSATLVDVVGGDQKMSPSEMRMTVAESGLSDFVKTLARLTLDNLEAVESEVHGSEVGETHLHELGTIDTVVDVVGFLSAVEIIGIKRIFCSSLTLGSRTIQMRHGEYPNPSPGVSALVREMGAPIKVVDEAFEYVTPTAAALLLSLKSYGMLEFATTEGSLRAIGYGAGHRVRDGKAGVLSCLVMDSPDRTTGIERIEDVVELSVYLDDVSGELLGGLVDRALEAGALDGWIAPVLGKKARPGYSVTVLSKPEVVQDLVGWLHGTTGSPGIRMLPLQRSVLDTNFELVEMDGHSVRIKKSSAGYKVEYEDAKRLASVLKMSTKDVIDKILAIYHEEGE